jgi:peptidoglycan/LPS O-acetylase OafA/YrhL
MTTTAVRSEGDHLGDAAPTAPADAASTNPAPGTRTRLDHIDAMRPVKQVGVVSTHTLLFFAPAAAGSAVGASILLLHVTREAFLFVSACMLTYSYRGFDRLDLRHFFGRRFVAVGVPYLAWTLIYFCFLLPTSALSLWASLGHLGYLVGTGYYQLYYLLVIAQFYAVFPLLLVLLRRTAGHHVTLLACSGGLQVVIISLMHWNALPAGMEGFWATREITSYQFYLIAGMVVAVHLRQVHAWLCNHVWTVVGSTLASAAVAEVWFYLANDHIVSWLGLSSDAFQPVVIPFNIGAIASLYLFGVFLVSRRRSPRTRAVIHSGSENSYGIYLSQMIFITTLVWVGWRQVNDLLPWPLVSVITVALVVLASTGLTALLARTPLSRALTGRSRSPSRPAPPAAPVGSRATVTPVPSRPVTTGGVRSRRPRRCAGTRPGWDGGSGRAGGVRTPR